MSATAPKLRTVKRCSRCGLMKNEFYASIPRICKDCIKAAAARWRQANRDKAREYDARYERRDSRAYYADYRARNRRQLRSYAHRRHHERYDTDPAYRLRCKMHDALRRARKRAGAVAFTIEQLEAKFAYWNDCCWVCGDTATEVDHVKPLAAGGKHMLCNLRPICESCNRRKHGRWPVPSRADILGFVA